MMAALARGEAEHVKLVRLKALLEATGVVAE
jgi:hypothetical protein